MTVYADILLLINFSMDLLTLCVTGRVLHKPLRKKRLVIASLIGAVCGTAYSLVQYSGAVLSLAVGLVLSVVMVTAAFGTYRSAVPLLRDALSVWGGGTLLGGIMTFLLSLGEPVYTSENRSFLPAFAVCLFISLGMTRHFSSQRTKRSLTVTAWANGTAKTFSALCDSGSFASEPISGLPVIIVKSSAVYEWSRQLRSEVCPLRLRMVPLHGIGGDCLLTGFLPDKVMIGGREVSAVIAVQESGADFAGYDAVLPAALCREGR